MDSATQKRAVFAAAATVRGVAVFRVMVAWLGNNGHDDVLPLVLAINVPSICK